MNRSEYISGQKKAFPTLHIETGQIWRRPDGYETGIGKRIGVGIWSSWREDPIEDLEAVTGTIERVEIEKGGWRRVK